MGHDKKSHLWLLTCLYCTINLAKRKTSTELLPGANGAEVGLIVFAT
jgi:hypothetical protein